MLISHVYLFTNANEITPIYNEVPTFFWATLADHHLLDVDIPLTNRLKTNW